MNGAIDAPGNLETWGQRGLIPGAPPAIAIPERFPPIRLIRPPTTQRQPISAHLKRPISSQPQLHIHQRVPTPGLAGQKAVRRERRHHRRRLRRPVTGRQRQLQGTRLIRQSGAGRAAPPIQINCSCCRKATPSGWASRRASCVGTNDSTAGFLPQAGRPWQNASSSAGVFINPGASADAPRPSSGCATKASDHSHGPAAED